MASRAHIQFRLRVVNEGEIAVGPGKADLLEAIAATGSITGAAKQLGMSYQRACDPLIRDERIDPRYALRCARTHCPP